MHNKSEYKSLQEWNKAKPKDYGRARRLNIVNDIADHFGWDRLKVNGTKWTKEACIESAKQCKTRWEWVQVAQGAYTAAKKNGWFEECTKHMKYITRPTSHYTKEVCMNSSKDCKTVREWQAKASGAVKVSKRMGWYEECKAHMVVRKIKPKRTPKPKRAPKQRKHHKPCGYWDDKETFMNEFLIHKTKTQLKLNSKGAYKAGKRNGWI